ncbi:ATP synthase F1 subunit delta [Gimesia chilikensis]|uniref:ATP synthase F1 subunit delta n=1 Tax=Gimesia chilikensis TaxID=2605989 RepID=UPI00119CB873|nr:ATP synthase F1 subunit delta [Gimesia chilikensis]KAA0139289.1 ATP synthase F1 subunit delta [Gimesia chilikensis]
MNDQEQVKARIPSVMDDPGAISVAKVYAKAFLGSVPESDKDSAIEEFAEFLNVALNQYPQFGKMLTTRSLNKEESLKLIDRAIAPHASELLANFLRVLGRHERLNLLQQIYTQINKLRDEEAGKKAVVVKSAFELSDSILDSIRQRLNDSLGFIPVLQTSIDQTVLGGLVIQVDDTVYDGSLRTRLKQLRGRLDNRSIHEIQSGRDRFSYPEGN